MTAKILIVGCGAIGGLFASALAKVADVTGLDANAAHVAAIKRDGLRVTGKSPRTVRLDITGSVEDLRGKSFDAIFFLIKSKATAAVLAQLRPVLSGRPVLVTLQNGMGNAEALLAMPDAIVARGATMNAGRYVEPGAVENLIEGKAGSARCAAASRTSPRSAPRSMRPVCRRKSSPTRWARWVEIRLQLRDEPARRADDGRQRRPPQFAGNAGTGRRHGG